MFFWGASRILVCLKGDGRQGSQVWWVQKGRFHGSRRWRLVWRILCFGWGISGIGRWLPAENGLVPFFSPRTMSFPPFGLDWFHQFPYKSRGSKAQSKAPTQMVAMTMGFKTVQRIGHI